MSTKECYNAKRLMVRAIESIYKRSHLFFKPFMIWKINIKNIQNKLTAV